MCVLAPPTKIHPQTPQNGNSPVLKLLNPPSCQTFYSPLRLEMKDGELKLMHKPLIQRNCQQIKKIKSEEIQ